MQVILTLIRRELGTYFLSFTGYVIIAASSFLTGLSFVVLLVKLRAEPLPIPVTEMYYLTPFFWMVLLLAAPVITMRLFALEKFSGTFETLMTTPVGDLQVVLAKFVAAQLFYMVMWLPLLVFLFVIQHFSTGTSGVDGGTLAGTFLGIFLLGGLFIALGCFASSLTSNQVIAAMVSLAMGLTFFLLSFLSSQVPGLPPWVASVLSRLAFVDQMHDFVRGVVDTRPAVVYLSLTLFFLFLTLRAVESRRWK
jgi:gliding motility-associated transport system permease protein